jgi:hypothetical protein
MSPMPCLLLLTDCCVHHERVNEVKPHNAWKMNKTWVFIFSNVVKFSLSIYLSISLCFLKAIKLNELKLFCSSVNNFLVVNQLLRLCQLSRHLQIKTGFVVPQHDLTIFTLVLQDVFKFPKIILSTMYLHKKDNSLKKNQLNIWPFISGAFMWFRHDFNVILNDI